MIISIFRFLNFFGLAVLLGGLANQFSDKNKKITKAILHGSMTQLATGIILTGIKGSDVNHFKVTIKLCLLLPIVFLVVKNKSKTLSNNSYYFLLILSIFITGIAAIWK
ncbi:hypothetical protein ACFL1M_01155 [Patescibacteria group bacterium]